jgi:signal transduction histidine kinase
MPRLNRLRNRLMIAFASFALAVAALFTLYAAVFVYSVEDSFFSTMLAQEAELQLRHYSAHGEWAVPRSGFMRVHTDIATLPDDIGITLRAEPRRTEIAGKEGRHYHLRRMQPPSPAHPAWLVAEVSRQLVVRPMRGQMLALLAWSGAAMTVLALLIGWWLARRTANPLARLATLVDGMNPAQLPERFAQGYPDDEVGAVAHGLEVLMNRIRAFIEREQAFTRDASHELRTPLTVIRSAAERLATEPALSDPGRRYVEYVQHSVRQLEQTVTILLSLAREAQVESKGPIAVLPALEHAIVDQSPLLEGKPVSVDVRIDNTVRVTMPEPVLHILLANLVGNAFAHTDAGEVIVDVHDGRLRIVNTGQGIDPAVFEDLHRAFNKGRDSTGFGLGLAIVGRLCDRYGIDLRIESLPAATIASFRI